MTTVRQTVTTVQSQQGRMDNNLDALLEDLQTSVSTPPSSTMNGLGGTSSRSYREVTRSIQQEAVPVPRDYQVTHTVPRDYRVQQEYRTVQQENTVPRDYRVQQEYRTVQQETLPRDYRQQVVTRTVTQDSVPQVQYLSAANPTTVVQERAPSPMNPGEQRSMTAYKTVSYQYQTNDKQQAAPVLDTKVLTSKSASDERLQQNLTELDSLLVDLHQAQKTGFGSPQGTQGGTTTTRTEVVTTGIDPGLLEPIDHSTPAPPTRQQQHISRSVQYKYNTQQYNSENSSPVRYQVDTPSPRLQPKRSSSANRELTYGPNEPGHTRTTRSPSPMRQRDPSPQRTPYGSQHTTVHKETYYENKLPSTRSQTMPHEHYRDKSPSNQRLQREMYYETKTTGTVPPSPRYREMSPPSQRRGTSPVPPIQSITSSSPEPYPGQPGGSSRVTTVRTYNYSTNTTGTPPPSRSPYPAPSPIPVSKSPYPEPVSVTELSPSPHRSPPASSPEHYPQTLPPGVLPYPPPPHVPGQPPTKVITTVHTYTYEIPGQPGVNHPYPPPGTTTTTYVNSMPPDAPDYPGPGDRTLTYHVSPQLPREKEPLLPQEQPPIIHPAEPQQPPTVITYKYSTHHTSHTNNKYPGGPPHPEEQQPLLPRPFPTSSPPLGQPSEGQPPKKLDDLMASFGDQKEPISPNTYYKTEKTTTTTTNRHPGPEGNGVAIVPPQTASVKSSETEKAVVKAREKSVNKAGPPVYYPPGVELFAKKEESMMTQGSKKASASSKYKYESESKSKSSSGGGAAVVPVCLPLCCAMPCVIL